ncbi:hypothetical protein F5877DRAFT_69276 [Lentinula edodes]|nr:hypothetical protein F5877DRAFT_69276 [Lentinula edodes]
MDTKNGHEEHEMREVPLNSHNQTISTFLTLAALPSSCESMVDVGKDTRSVSSSEVRKGVRMECGQVTKSIEESEGNVVDDGHAVLPNREREVKRELLKLAGYKSSYIHMTDLVDQMFPPIHRESAPEFTNFEFWKPPIQEFPLPDFSPPPPAPSAQSDSSTFVCIRNFCLVGTRQNNIPKVAAAVAAASSCASNDKQPLRNLKLQQMSSFQRLSSMVGFSGNGISSSILKDHRSDSPDTRSYSSSSYAGSEDEDEDDGWNGGRCERRRSTTSMPGSLEDMNFGDDNDASNGSNNDHNGEDPRGEDEVDEVAADDMFDEDLLAAG